MLWRLWTIWDITGRDPYCVYHCLDDEFVPVEGGVPMPPPFPERLRDVLFAFGAYSQERKDRLAGAKPRAQRGARRAPRQGD